MPKNSRWVSHFGIAVLALSALAACSRGASTAPAAQQSRQAPKQLPPFPWATHFIQGDRSLTLQQTGTFEYKGTYCMHGGDVGFEDAFNGIYTAEQTWVNLQPSHAIPTQGCSVDMRLYATRLAGHLVLVEEGDLKRLVNRQRSAAPDNVIYPWHLPGDPDTFKVNVHEFLPAPFTQLLEQPPPAGKVIAVENVSTWKPIAYFGPRETLADLTLNIGTKAGVFVGAEVCHVRTAPGKNEARGSYEVVEVTANTALIHWSWPVGTARAHPKRGMRFTTECGS